MSKFESIIKRYEGNPIITVADMPYHCNSVFNPGATKFDGKYLLLLRVESKDGRTHLNTATSDDGYKFEINDKPVMVPSEEEPFKTYEEKGISDPRITKIDNTYYILYMAVSRFGIRIGIASTEDFQTFKRIALGSEVDNRNGVLFPEKIDGEYVRLDRPMGCSAPHNIWISYSPDLVYWGRSKVLMEVRPTWQSWDFSKIGPGAPPIKTEKGWLEIYHGVKGRTPGLYRLGCVLFDLKDPSKVIGQAKEYILSPEEPYERNGDVPNVVFTCGAIPEYDTGEIKIYYGAADTCIGVGTVEIDELVKICLS